VMMMVVVLSSCVSWTL